MELIPGGEQEGQVCSGFRAGDGGGRCCWGVFAPVRVRDGGRLLFCLKALCLLQTHQLDYSAHYLRLKFLMENQIQFYLPKPEEEIYELVMLPTGLMK